MLFLVSQSNFIVWFFGCNLKFSYNKIVVFFSFEIQSKEETKTRNLNCLTGKKDISEIKGPECNWTWLKVRI